MVVERYRISVDGAVKYLNQNHSKNYNELGRDKILVRFLREGLIIPFRRFDGEILFVHVDHVTPEEKNWKPTKEAPP